ncbi:MAG: FIST N-terminal domain-containing protein [Actinomycetota bacterium]|nr:FIST N-terminal domain-containing protein [Actinomycetota bacterium]
MPFAAGLSEHPLPSHAIGEAVGQVLDGGCRNPDLVAMFVSGSHAEAFAQLAEVVRETLSPGALIGATASSVLCGPREVEDHPAVAVWAAEGIGPARPVRLETVRTSAGTVITGLGRDGGADIAEVLGDDRCLVVVADPFSFDTVELCDQLSRVAPGSTVVGGVASASRSPGGNRLLVDDAVVHDGAVGVIVDAASPVRAVVSQGCRPVGDPYVVTRAERNVIVELAGRPALERLEELLARLAPAERTQLASGVHLGRVIDEHKIDFDRGDFLVRNVLGADRSKGAIAVAEPIDVGTSVQFQLRDAASADEDLRLLLDGEAAGGALVFTCNGRGRHLFGAPDHDAQVVTETLGTTAAAGMFCAGEVGPVGGRSFLHSFTASVALFRERNRS